jgi:hypothetical protein
MRSNLPAAAALALALAVLGGAPNRAAATELASPEHAVASPRHHARQWPWREYWQWDHRPIWDDPWVVLRPNFWGSPEPHLVPADIWACKWHLPSPRKWQWHRRCGVWVKARRDE